MPHAPRPCAGKECKKPPVLKKATHPTGPPGVFSTCANLAQKIRPNRALYTKTLTTVRCGVLGVLVALFRADLGALFTCDFWGVFSWCFFRTFSRADTDSAAPPTKSTDTGVGATGRLERTTTTGRWGAPDPPLPPTGRGGRLVCLLARASVRFGIFAPCRPTPCRARWTLATRARWTRAFFSSARLLFSLSQPPPVSCRRPPLPAGDRGGRRRFCCYSIFSVRISTEKSRLFLFPY